MQSAVWLIQYLAFPDRVNRRSGARLRILHIADAKFHF